MQRTATLAGEPAISVPDLRTTIAGSVIAPDDKDYDEARAEF